MYKRFISRLGQERGLGLVEVMVASAVLLLVAATVLASLNHSSKLSGMARAKAIAGNLAQQDQERLRGRPPASLYNFFEVRTVGSNGARYTVTSTGTFVSEATRTPGCTSTARADFVKITSSVRSKALGGSRPVYLESLINPAVGSFGGTLGSVVVKITNAAGGPVAGIPVTIAGPGNFTQPTSPEGCAFFAYVPVGQYTYSYASSGWVDQSGQTDVSLQASVQSDRTNSYQTTYDRAGWLEATFETRVSGVTQPSKAQAITVVHPNVPGDGSRVFPASTPPATKIVTGGLFPFTSPYVVYSGSCSSNALPDALTSQLPTGRYQSQQQIAPATNYLALVFEPAIDLTVTSAGAPVDGARVFAMDTRTGCATTIDGKTGSNGKLPDPGFPHGAWNICADVIQTNGLRSKAATVAPVVNDQLEGVKVTLDIPASAVDDPCVV